MRAVPTPFMSRKAVMQQLHIALALVGLTAVAVGLLSNRLEHGPFQRSMVAVFVGFAAGRSGLGWLDVSSWGDTNAILEVGAQLTLAIGLMGVALRLKRSVLRQIWRPVAVLLVLGMVGMWLAASALAGCCSTSGFGRRCFSGRSSRRRTPVVASAIVTGSLATSSLPDRLRQTLSLESGANDGLAYLFVLLPILMLEHGSGEAWGRWLVEGLVGGIFWSFAIGAGAGRAASWLLVRAERADALENVSLLGYTVAFSLATVGAAEILGGNGIIAVFVAGAVFNFTVPPREEHEEEQVQEAVARLFTLPMFVIFGAVLPLEAWSALGWPLVAFAVLAILLRRPPVLAVILPLLRPLTLRDSAFLGWFGPIGVAAIYYAAHAEAQTGDSFFWHAASAVVLASILAHGFTASAFTRAYAGQPSRPFSARS